MDIRSTSPAVLTATPTVEAIRCLAAQSLARESGAAFQSLLAAGSDALARLARSVRRAEDAAISLAQREHAHEVAQDLGDARDALCSGLAESSRCLRAEAPSLSEALRGLLRPDRQRLAVAARAVRTAAARPKAESAPDWFAATTDAVEALGEAAEHLDALALAQPPASATRALGCGLAAFLRERRDALLGDIARLVD